MISTRSKIAAAERLPGSAVQWNGLTDMTDARHLARAGTTQDRVIPVLGSPL